MFITAAPKGEHPPSSLRAANRNEPLTMLERRTLFAVLKIQADDVSDFPLTCLRAHDIKQHLSETFVVSDENLQMALARLQETKHLQTFATALTPNDPIYDLTPKSREALGMTTHQISTSAALEGARKALSIRP